MTQGYALFETPIGECALIWQDELAIGSQLPEASREKALARLQRRFPDAVEAEPPAAMRAAMQAILALLEGEARDLSGIALDRTGLSDFNRRVYEVALAIPAGETLTYGEVAARIGEPGAARAVGVALGQNPWPIIVPCHRVLAANGGTGGFSADGGVETKLRMLTIEKARTSAEPSLFGALPLEARRR